MGLHEQLLTAETRFLSAIARGPDAVSAFDKHWAALFHDLTSATRAGQVDVQTSHLAHLVASRVSILADSFLALERDAKELSSRYHDQSTQILAQAAQQGMLHSQSAVATLDSASHHWLVHHLSDPYPPTDVKKSIAESCGHTIKDVQDWFADVRRQIGWTALAQEKFGGSRRAIAEAASHAYGAEQDRHTLQADLQRAFATIKLKVEAIQPRNDDLSEAGDGVESGNETLVAELEREITFSEAEEEDTSPPPPIAGFKRSRDTFMSGMYDACEQLPSPVIGTPPIKRRRHAFGALERSHSLGARSADSHPAIIPSKVDISRESPAVHPAQFPPSVLSSSETITEHATSNAPMSRKRRLSDADFTIFLKRPRGLVAGHRNQVVSDPMPVTLGFNPMEVHRMDDWLQQGLAVPDPTDTGALDPSLFPVTDSAIAIATCGENSASLSSIGPFPPASQLDVSNADLISATTSGFDLSTYDSNPSAAWDAGFFLDFDSNISDNSSAHSPSSASSLSELSDYGLPYPANGDWTQDWTQFVNILDSLGASPSSSQSSIQKFSQSTADTSSVTSAGETCQPLFGVDPPFTDLLSDIDEFASLHMPLEPMF